MDKRYQVFVSSTFSDLEEERTEVTKAILKTSCFPAGMELFPASASNVFEYIRPIIESSDYFVLVLAGRYGSIDATTGKSYTEMEYDVAKAAGIPTLCFLHSDPFKKLPGEKIERGEAGRDKLEKFTEKVRSENLVKLWDEPQRLGLEVMSALLEAFQHHPRDGWTRASKIASVEAEKEIAELKLYISELKKINDNSDENENIERRVINTLHNTGFINKNDIKNIISIISNIDIYHEIDLFMEHIEVDEDISKEYIYLLIKILIKEGVITQPYDFEKRYEITEQGRRFLASLEIKNSVSLE